MQPSKGGRSHPKKDSKKKVVNKGKPTNARHGVAPSVSCTVTLGRSELLSYPILVVVDWW
uniref:Uncharacterized protein n=1 Tax=Arundo donax TaxID=35708 RepID=A0A0A9H0S7_ARUDO